MANAKSAWLMWFIAVGFFAFQFVLRLFPGLVIPELMGKFQIDATAFGVLSAAYYFGYAGFQIPVGILLDKYNPRVVIAGSAFLCGIGTLSFVYSDIWAITILGRFLIGAGSAAGFLGVAKVIRLAFPENRFTTMIGLTFTLGLMGALYGGKPVSQLMEQMGWVYILNMLAILSFVFAAGIYFLFPKTTGAPSSRVQSSSEEHPVSVMESLRAVVANKKIIWIGLAGALLVGPLEGFADVWGVSYLVNVHGFSKADASLISSCIYFGMLFGGPLLSSCAQKFQSYYFLTALCGLFMASIFGGMIMSDALSDKNTLLVMMTLTGVFSSYQAVVFAIVAKLVPARLSGLVTSVTNCINMSGGCLFHFIMGWIMDHKWSGAMENGIKVYDAHSYTSAISVIPIALVMGFIGFLLLQEKQPKLVQS